MATMFRSHDHASPEAPSWLLALGERTGSFAPDQRYSAAALAAAQTDAAGSSDDAARQAQAALDEAFEAGLARGRAESQAIAAAERAAQERLRISLARLDETMRRDLADRLADTVAELVEATLAPLALDPVSLERRCAAAAEMLGEAQENLALHLHPDDVALLDPEFAAGWTIVPAPESERGTVRVEGTEGGAVDGPAEWRAALAAAFSC